MKRTLLIFLMLAISMQHLHRKRAKHSTRIAMQVVKTNRYTPI